MGWIVIIGWVLFFMVFFFHLNKPKALPLKFRIISLYIPLILTMIYSFMLKTEYGVMAVIAIILVGWQDWGDRKTMS